MPATIYTIGHSTHSLEAFIALLKAQNIEVLVDIRTYPGSRKWPWFGQQQLREALRREGIGYVWLGQELGGRRKGVVEGSGNEGWRIVAFRSYADYASTDPVFTKGLKELEGLACACRVAYMCSEHTHLRCHRRIVSDWLYADGWDVMHITADGKVEQHLLSSHAVIDRWLRVTYPQGA